MLKYIAEAGLSWEAIGQQLVTNILLPEGAVRSGQNICKGCASGHFETSLMKWWIWYQEEFRVESERENCWYGYTCRTQTHRPDHAARYVIACTQRVYPILMTTVSTTPATPSLKIKPGVLTAAKAHPPTSVI